MGESKSVGKGCRALAACLVFALVMLTAVSASAQGEAGTILGTIRDSSGGVVPNARVTVTNNATNDTRMVTTGDDGAYRFPGLRAGLYTMRVEASGFQTQTVTSVNLPVATELVTNATLQVGSSTQEVTVTGEAPVVNTTTSSLGSLINDQTIAELPLNGRNYTDLTLLTPGIVTTTHSGLGDAGTWFSSSGAPPRSNNYTLDGALTVTKNGTGPASMTGNTLGVDGIKEYKMVTSMFSAEYGLLMGSQMVIASKGGSNEWHGNLFEYLRNNHMDARNFFAAQPDVTNNILTDASGNAMRNAQFKRNNFGGSFGGPIQKDKTFFWLVYEGVRMAQGDTIIDTAMPDACHFWNDAGGNPIIVGGGKISPSITDIATNFPNHVGAPQIIMDGFNQAAIPGATMAYSGCGVAAGAPISVVSQPWIGQFPFRNIDATTRNYTFNGKTLSRDDYAQLRVDHNFGTNDTGFARYTFADGKINTPYSNGDLSGSDSGIGYPQFPIVGTSRNQYITLGENHIFTPTLLNSIRLSFSRTMYTNRLIEAFSELNPDFLLHDPAGSPCLSGGDCIWSFVPGHVTGGYLPGSGITNLNSAGTYPNYHISNTWTLGDDVFYTKGKHAFKFGTLINRMNQPHLQSKAVNGTVQFAGLTQFVQGLPRSVNVVLPGQSVAKFPGVPGAEELAPPFNGGYLDRNFTWYTIGLYLQDDYRLTQNFTLNLGFRYEFRTDLSEQYGRDTNIVDIHSSTTWSATNNGIITNPTFKNFSPRVGFAWDVFGNGRTAVRSGFGIYYDIGNYGALLTQGSTGLPPFIANTTYQNELDLNLEKGCTGAAVGTTCLPLPIDVGGGSAGKSLQQNDYIADTPHSLQYNLTIEQQLPGGMGLAVSYVGRRGINLYTGVEGNPVRPELLPNGTFSGLNGVPPSYNVAAGQAGCLNNSLDVDPVTGVPQPFQIAGVPVGPSDLRYPCRVNPYWGSSLFYTNAASSWYNGLQVGLNKRLSHGLQFQVAYTYSRATDDTQGTRFNNDCGGPTQSAFGRNPYDVSQDYGASCYNVPHSMRFNALYHLPTIGSNGFGSKLVNGWWIGSIVSLQQGSPFTPIVRNVDRSFGGIVSQSQSTYATLNSVANTAVTNPAGGQYNWIPYDPETVILGDPSNWFNPLMFGVPALGTRGNGPRSILDHPKLANWDFSIVKDTKVGWLGEAGNIQFRAEFFNILNRANFNFLNNGSAVFQGGVNTTADCAVGENIAVRQAASCNLFRPNGATASNPLGVAGQIDKTATTARQVQLALRLQF